MNKRGVFLLGVAAILLASAGCVHRPPCEGAKRESVAAPMDVRMPPLGALAEKGACVVLVPFPGCDTGLLVTVRGRLADELGIPVAVRTLAWTESAAARDQRSRMIDSMRAQLQAHETDARVVDAMKTLHLGRESLEEDGNVVSVMKRMLATAEPDAPAKLDACLLAAEGQNPQWDADAWLNRFAEAVDPCRSEAAAYIGVTPRDIYAKDYNFLFGWSCSRGAVVSYRRFAAARGPVDDGQVIRRLLKQCLSSVGLIYGIPRCADPSCARAYPNSLSEHDAKGETLCPLCRQRLKEKFAAFSKKP